MSLRLSVVFCVLALFSLLVTASEVTLNVTSSFNITALQASRAFAGLRVPDKYLPAGATLGAQFRAVDIDGNIVVLTVTVDTDGSVAQHARMVANATAAPGHYRAVVFPDGGSGGTGLTVAGTFYGHYLSILDNAFSATPTLILWEYPGGTHYNPSAAKSIVIGADYENQFVFTLTDNAELSKISVRGGRPALISNITLQGGGGKWPGDDERHCAGSVSRDAKTAVVFCSYSLMGTPSIFFRIDLTSMTVVQSAPAVGMNGVWVARANPTLTWDEASGRLAVTMLSAPNSGTKGVYFVNDQTFDVVGSANFPAELAMIDTTVWDRVNSLAHLLANNFNQVFTVDLSSSELVGTSQFPNPSSDPINQQFVNSIVLDKTGKFGIAIEVGPSYQSYGFLFELQK
jgi:hypothetical protein